MLNFGSYCYNYLDMFYLYDDIVLNLDNFYILFCSFYYIYVYYMFNLILIFLLRYVIFF